MSVKDTFQKLKLSIIGTKTTSIDQKLDDSIKDITSYKSNSGQRGYIDLVKSLISKSNTNSTLPMGNSGGLFAQTASPVAFGQGSRIIRYRSYDAIISNINYCYRALEVLTDNILAPDDITKVSLEIQPVKYIKDDIPSDSKATHVKEVVKKIKLEKYLRSIIKSTLTHGDYFCEIADAKTALISKAYLNESMLDLEEGKKEILEFKVDKSKYKVTMDYSAYYEEQENSEGGEKSVPLHEINLVFHHAKKIVKLQSDMFPLCFGYLIFPMASVCPQATLMNQAVDDICAGMLKSLEKKIPQMSEFSNDKELKDIISTMIKETGTNQIQSMGVRYVPPSKVQHFMTPGNKYYPYGESVFDSCNFIAKILIALETALAIQRINRSTEKRKISVEVGLPRDAKKMIESLKEEFRKRKISLDNFGAVDTIPSMISTFEDIYIPQKDGKPFVDIGTFTEGNVDIRSKVDELKFLRDQVVASLGVPPSFVGIEEGLCVTLDTKIPMVNGSVLTLQEIIDKFDDGVCDVYSCTKEGFVVPGKITWAGVTKKQTQVIRVWLDNNEFIDCTPDHPFMLRDGTYTEAQKLVEGTSLMPFYKYSGTPTGDYFEIYHPGTDNWENIINTKIRKDESLYIPEITPSIDQCHPTNHKVMKIEILEGLQDTGDITVENYHNFATEAGVFVHNSNKNALTEENILFARTVINHQKYFSEQITNLIEKVFVILQPEEALTIMDGVTVSLPSPKSLQFEREARYMTELANLIETMTRIGVPSEYVKMKYLTSIDWEDMKRYQTDETIDKKLSTDVEKDEELINGGTGGF